MSRECLSLKCPNCGNEFTVFIESTPNTYIQQPGYCCPVCQYRVVPVASSETSDVLTLPDLQARIDILLETARVSGVRPSEIVGVLRDELQFEAALAQIGRRLIVTIIDLGPEELLYPAAAVDPHDILNRRRTP